mgnify:CR=1 FL=1
MSKDYMIGTLADYPLLKVTLNGVDYFVDETKKEVYLDDRGLPKLEDKEIVKSVLEAVK